MKEDFLYYIWMHHLRLNVKYRTASGQSFVVLNKGVKNTDAGADIWQARIVLDSVEWVGNVEFHVKASDWNVHNHQLDVAYNNVILHFVADADKTVYTENGRALPNVVFPDLAKWYAIFESTFISEGVLACENFLNPNSLSSLRFMLSRLTIERLEEKSKSVYRLLEQNKNNWEEVLYQIVVRYLGQKLNGDIFEMLARSLPQNIVGKHKDNLFQVETLLFGQGGFLTESIPDDEYYNKMKQEYIFLKSKYKLIPLSGTDWKFFRLRPANFPTIRIAQLAMLMHKSASLFSRLIERQEVENYREMFKFGVSMYWESHYKFGKKSKRTSKHEIGSMLQDVIIINAVVPVLFAYAQYIADEDLQEYTLQLLESVEGEDNYITRTWQRFGVVVKSASDSQGLLQLTENYCKFKHCQVCAIGHEILKERYEL